MAFKEDKRITSHNRFEILCPTYNEIVHFFHIAPKLRIGFSDKE